jgi:prophage regulatory protein
VRGELACAHSLTATETADQAVKLGEVARRGQLHGCRRAPVLEFDLKLQPFWTFGFAAHPFVRRVLIAAAAARLGRIVRDQSASRAFEGGLLRHLRDTVTEGWKLRLPKFILGAMRSQTAQPKRQRARSVEVPPAARRRRLIRMPALLEKLGVGCRQTIYKWTRNGDFPLPISIGGNSIAWYEDEVDGWMATRGVPTAYSKAAAEAGAADGRGDNRG